MPCEEQKRTARDEVEIYLNWIRLATSSSRLDSSFGRERSRKISMNHISEDSSKIDEVEYRDSSLFARNDVFCDLLQQKHKK